MSCGKLLSWGEAEETPFLMQIQILQERVSFFTNIFFTFPTYDTAVSKNRTEVRTFGDGNISENIWSLNPKSTYLLCAGAIKWH